ncbi:MAG: SH3 domain-containing protein [Candidatus Eremiobacteraeota bacterium]|nr:SH3 domain-containing protein [Candidatus Eremiobacteraeota bacterium]
MSIRSSLILQLLICLSLCTIALADGYRYGVVQDEDGWTNVRESASLESKVIERVYSDDRVIVTGEQGDFYDCMSLFQSGELPETFGFIHRSRVKNVRPALGAGIVSDPDGWSYLRSGADSSSKPLRKLYPGQGFFVVLGKSGDWYKIETRDGTVGFLHGSRLEWVIPRN